MKNADDSISEFYLMPLKRQSLKVEELKKNTDSKLKQEIESIRKKSSAGTDAILEIVKRELL